MKRTGFGKRSLLRAHLTIKMGRSLQGVYPVLFLFLVCCCGCNPGAGKQKKIKRIETFNFYDEVPRSRAGEIFRTGEGMNKVENFDSLGNLVRENGFDSRKNEENTIEYIYDSSNKLAEKITYKKYHNLPLAKEHIYRYVYKRGLLTEILYYFRSVDSIGFYAKNQITYNDQQQKIKDEFTAYNEDRTKETRTFSWKDKFSYAETRINQDGDIERHFIKLDNKGRETEHRMQFSASATENSSYPMGFTYTFDNYGNELTKYQ